MANNKISIQKLYDEIIPIKLTVMKVETLLITHLKKYDDDCEENKDKHDKLEKKIGGKISIRAFVTGLTVLSIIVGIIISIVALR